jgi:hypothetical protein
MEEPLDGELGVPLGFVARFESMALAGANSSPGVEWDAASFARRARSIRTGSSATASGVRLARMSIATVRNMARRRTNDAGDRIMVVASCVARGMIVAADTAR